MEFWDDLTKKVGEAATATKKGAEKLSGIAKVKYQIALKQSKLERTFETIGKMKYEEYKDNADNKEVIETLLADAEALDAEIAALKDELAGLSGLKNCPTCNTKVTKETAFCPKCGYKFEATTDEEVKEETTEEE